MQTPALDEWYRVRFDARAVYRDVAPPGREPWADEFAWDAVVRVCVLTHGLLESDELFVFTSERAESYLIPTEADGARELLDEIVRRGLFPAETLVEAAATEDTLFCWPADGAS